MGVLWTPRGRGDPAVSPGGEWWRGWGRLPSTGRNPATKRPPASPRPPQIPGPRLPPCPKPPTPAHPCPSPRRLSKPQHPRTRPAIPPPSSQALALTSGWAPRPPPLPPASTPPAPRLSCLARLHPASPPLQPAPVRPPPSCSGIPARTRAPGTPLPRQFRTLSSPGKKAAATFPRPFWGWGWLLLAATCVGRLRVPGAPRRAAPCAGRRAWKLRLGLRGSDRTALLLLVNLNMSRSFVTHIHTQLHLLRAGCFLCGCSGLSSCTCGRLKDSWCRRMWSHIFQLGLGIQL